MRLLSLTVALTISLVFVSANAQVPLVLDMLKRFNDAAPVPQSSVLVSEVMKSALTIQKDKGGCLPTSAVIDTVTPATGVRFALQQIVARQMKNAWTVIVRHPNCGNDIIRYAVVQQSDDSLYSFRINRGQSNANESLIGDTLPSALAMSFLTLKRAKIDCDIKDDKDFTMGVTRIVRESTDLGPETYGVRYIGIWQEIWPITLCGRTVEVGIDFKADGDGGAYTDIKNDNVKLLPKSN